MGDEEVGDAALLLEVVHEVQHLRPHRHVERSDGLVGDDEVGLERRARGRWRRAGADRPRAPPGSAPSRRRSCPTRSSSSFTLRTRSLRSILKCTRSGSATDSPTGTCGSSELYGSWNTICMRRRSARRSRPPSARHVDTVEAHRALVGLDQPQHEPAGRGLPRAGLADQGERLAPLEREADVVDRGEPVGGAPERVALGREPLREALDLERGSHLHAGTTMPRQLELVGAAGSARSTSPRRSSGGTNRRRTGRAAKCGQRGWKRHPAALARRGHVARDVDEAAALTDRRDRRRADPTCTGGGAARRRLRRSPARPPGPAYITTTRSAISAMTPRSWLMKRMAIPVSCLDLADEVEDVRLHRHVERGRRFVGDQERRLARQRHRDHHPLAHAAAERVRVLRRPRFARAGCWTRSSISTARFHASLRDTPSGGGPSRRSARRP